jgi:hypothetical protein
MIMSPLQVLELLMERHDEGMLTAQEWEIARLTIDMERGSQQNRRRLTAIDIAPANHNPHDPTRIDEEHRLALGLNANESEDNNTKGNHDSD